MPKEEVDLDTIDRSAPIGSLTVGQFMEITSFDSRRKQVDDRLQEISKVRDEAKELHASMAVVFKNAPVLQATTPFEVSDTAALEKLVSSMREAIKDGGRLVVALGILQQGNGG